MAIVAFEYENLPFAYHVDRIGNEFIFNEVVHKRMEKWTKRSPSHGKFRKQTNLVFLKN